MNEKIHHVSEGDFETQVLNADGPVLVDYWAEWCGPCKQIAPLLDEMADEYDGKLKVVKVDIDSNVEIARKFQIRGIPTLMIFRDGQVQATKVGAVPRGALKSFIEENV